MPYRGVYSHPISSGILLPAERYGSAKGQGTVPRTVPALRPWVLGVSRSRVGRAKRRDSEGGHHSLAGLTRKKGGCRGDARR